MTEKFDVVVIGAGPGGMTAALYASRSNLKVLMLDRGIYGGQMNNTAAIDNYPGFTSILGPDLSKKMYEGSINFGAEYRYGVVESIDDNGSNKLIHTDSGDYETGVVIIATGSEHRKLGVPGEEEYSGRGVSYCAVCDGNFFKDKDIAVIGGGDSAIEEGLYLANLGRSVTVIHRRDQLKAQKILQDQAFANKKMHFIWNADVQSVEGDGNFVTGVHYLDKVTKEEHTLPASGVFIYVGLDPITEPFKDLGILDQAGWVISDPNTMETKIPGIFAVGDVRQKDLRQIANAVGEGAIAGKGAFDHLQSLAANNLNK